jgi:serine/threonine protein kinase
VSRPAAFAADADRTLGTPSDEDWPGVQDFPDYKKSFPRWARDHNAMTFANLDDVGHDLLEGLLVFDPSGRMSAKQAVGHEYFKGMHIVPNGTPGSYSVVVNGVGANGAHTNGFH